MGMYKIDNVSSEEWQRRMLRRYNIRQWILLGVMILAVAGMACLMVWALGVMKP